MAEDPTLPLTVGVGVDHGEAVPVEGGYRGRALNTAARLCSKAVAGEVLVTRAVAEAEAQVEEVQFEEHGALELKGLRRAGGGHAGGARSRRLAIAIVPPPGEPLPALAAGARHLHAAGGPDRSVALAPRGMAADPTWKGTGSVRLGTRRDREDASRSPSLPREVHGRTGVVRYAGAGGAGTALALRAVREAELTAAPTLLVLDDVDVLGQDVVALLDGSMAAVERRPVWSSRLSEKPRGSRR